MTSVNSWRQRFSGKTALAWSCFYPKSTASKTCSKAERTANNPDCHRWIANSHSRKPTLKSPWRIVCSFGTISTTMESTFDYSVQSVTLAPCDQQTHKTRYLRRWSELCPLHFHDGSDISQQLHVYTEATVLRASRSVVRRFKSTKPQKHADLRGTMTYTAIMRSANSNWNMITARFSKGRYASNFSTTGDEICRQSQVIHLNVTKCSNDGEAEPGTEC